MCNDWNCVVWGWLNTNKNLPNIPCFGSFRNLLGNLTIRTIKQSHIFFYNASDHKYGEFCKNNTFRKLADPEEIPLLSNSGKYPSACVAEAVLVATLSILYFGAKLIDNLAEKLQNRILLRLKIFRKCSPKFSMNLSKTH